MIILGIETSCDETAASIVEDGHCVKSNVIASQIKKHAAYGGVVPELAAREHTRAIEKVVNHALSVARIDVTHLDGVAVTSTPGLLPALLVGISYAKGLSAGLGIPLKGINHFIAHIFGAFLEKENVLSEGDTFPIIALVVSGGHTALTLLHADGRCQIVGRTLDDAAGEAFDKAAKILNLSYPGGPLIDKLAQRGDEKKYSFPRGLIGGNGKPVASKNRYHFSFSGVKTALLYHVHKQQFNLDHLDQDMLDTIASYQEAIVAALVKKALWAAVEFGAKTLVLCGGVACNTRLRAELQASADKHSIPLLIARPEYCTDNAAMIAGLSYYYFKSGVYDQLDLDAKPRLQEITSVPFSCL